MLTVNSEDTCRGGVEGGTEVQVCYEQGERETYVSVISGG